jgi:hypothetical protein
MLYRNTGSRTMFVGSSTNMCRGKTKTVAIEQKVHEDEIGLQLLGREGTQDTDFGDSAPA